MRTGWWIRQQHPKFVILHVSSIPSQSSVRKLAVKPAQPLDLLSKFRFAKSFLCSYLLLNRVNYLGKTLSGVQCAIVFFKMLLIDSVLREHYFIMGSGYDGGDIFWWVNLLRNIHLEE